MLLACCLLHSDACEHVPASTCAKSLPPQHIASCRRDRLAELQQERNAKLEAALAEQQAAAAAEEAATPASKRGLLPTKQKELPRVGCCAWVQGGSHD